MKAEIARAYGQGAVNYIKQFLEDANGNLRVSSEDRLVNKWISNNISHLKTFYEICIIKWFIDIVSPDNNLKEHLISLLASFPNVDTKAMGFPEHWELEPLWNK